MVETDWFITIELYTLRDIGSIEISNYEGQACVRVIEGAVVFRGLGDSLPEALENAVEDGWLPRRAFKRR